MDELTKLKSEAYDILVRIQHLQMLLEEKNQQITKAIEKQLAEQKTTTKKSK